MSLFRKPLFPAHDLSATFAPSVRPRNRRLHLALSGGILLLLLAVLWAELSTKEHLDELWQAFLRQLDRANWLWFAVAFLLVPLNWLAETRKWHQIVRQYEPMSTRRALLAVWIGVCFSLFTPNRVGEYGGRILLVRPENRWKAVIANIVGNYGQLLVLLTAGLWGANYFLNRFWVDDSTWFGPIGWLIGLGLVVLYFFYFNLGILVPLARRIVLPRRLQFLWKEVQVLQHFNRQELGSILVWAVVRYIVYATQYFLLLRFFGINPDFTAGYAGIAAIFLVQTSLPLPPLAGLVARGNLAVQVWSLFGANEISSLAATFALWIINLILPALIGTFSLFYVNIAKPPAHEDD
jgi:hypothetical protein